MIQFCLKTGSVVDIDISNEEILQIENIGHSNIIIYVHIHDTKIHLHEKFETLMENISCYGLI